MNQYIIRLSLLFSVVSFLSCNSSPKNDELPGDEKKEKWIALFEGKSTNGWHLYNAGKKASVWEVKDGELFCNPQSGKEHGDLVTDEEFENFDLVFEWKMAADGNSGVFINSIERDTIPAAWFSGPEYQLLGNNHEDYKIETKRAGCLYGFAPQETPVATKPVEEWNESRIKQVNGKVEFYLNGALTAEEDFKSQGWMDKVMQTHFKNFPEFGKHTQGHIVLQDWAKGVSFRNIKIKKL